MPQALPIPLVSLAPKLLHIFKPGRWTAMSGEGIEFSAADLAATAAAFDPAVARAPLVIGHPATDDPAQGWISGLVATERGLFASPAKVDPAFAEAVNAGRYGNVSAKFYRPTDANNPKPGVWYLRHLGFLGGTAPGVKGLDEPAFADGDEGVCFQEGMAWAGAPETEPEPETQKESPVTDEEKTALEAENARLKAELAAHKTAQVHADNAAFCDGLPGMLPAWRDVAVATLDHLATQAAPVEFGEGEAKAPLLAQLKGLFKSLPAPVQFSESATSGRAAAGTPGDGVAFASPAGHKADPQQLLELGRAQAYQARHGGDLVAAVTATRRGQV